MKNETALPHRFAPQAGRVSFRKKIEKAEDLDRAKKLISSHMNNARTSMEAPRQTRPSKLA